MVPSVRHVRCAGFGHAVQTPVQTSHLSIDPGECDFLLCSPGCTRARYFYREPLFAATGVPAAAGLMGYRVAISGMRE
jgi:hypothetical protein